jgi:hypothetical protein
MDSIRTFDSPRDIPAPRGVAMILALAVLMVVTLTVGILEEGIDRSLGFGEESIAKVRAEYAAYGGAVRAAANPPDAFTSFDYLGTRVDVTLSNPPVSLMEILISKTSIASGTDSPFEGNLRMMTSVVATPGEATASESTWRYLLIDAERPTLWTAWPGYH